MKSEDYENAWKHLKPQTTYERFEDMSPDGRLQVFIERDGDVIIKCMSGKDSHSFTCGSVQFCTPCSGGGQSPRVREALIQLALAIKMDNDEKPQHREAAR